MLKLNGDDWEESFKVQPSENVPSDIKQHIHQRHNHYCSEHECQSV